ncbi:MAG TPA: tubulin-like doman-containing protein [Micromonosporaceae bacterium]|nr:tubulin-like doman-containing protein [Micromonosporaceae bacterium]
MSEYQPMKIYQPMLFVGLGGTGCLIGAELERRLREELCGPDGTALVDRMAGKDFLPFQLPTCLQFVYADLNEAELSRMRSRVVTTDEHAQAAERTLHLARELVPAHDTYPEVARSLRLNVNGFVEGWLPPPAGEPRVAPLSRGAGQMPTVGRAALFETFRQGTAVARRPITEAIGLISKSGGELQSLGGQLRGSCDVFVAFSVAGGTGSGIFYDYLHLIGDALQREGYKAQIYPLVLMPSAFEDGMGGGRRARLNAGRALLDLFRLIDDQNGQHAGVDLNDVGVSGALAVRYPVEGEIRLRPSTVQTAFLFSKSAGVERDDLHRSVVSLVLSLVATAQETNDEVARPADRIYQSFADDFINRGVEREVIASSGVGNRGVSTSVVASMTVPVDDLADIISSRLLAEAVAELAVPAPGRSEANRPYIERFFGASELDPLRLRTPLPFNEPAVAKGADAILRALRNRVRVMEASLDSLEKQVVERCGALAVGFNPERAVEQLLTQVDLFRLRRVVLGDPRLPEALDRAGFVGVLERRRTEPVPPDGVKMSPPQPGELRNKLLGISRIRWGDPVVQQMVKAQDAWYRWRSQRAWHLAWAEQTPRWERKVRSLRRDLETVTDAFLEHANLDRSRFTTRVRDLYRPRTGVSYLLPPHGGDLELFYQNTLRRYIQLRGDQHRLIPTSTPAQVVNAIIGPDGWREAYTISTQRSPAHAAARIRDLLKQEVKQLFRNVEPGEQPLLPALADLLLAAVGKARVAIADEDLAQFRQKVAALVPGGFSPQGAGPMKVLVSYASPAKDGDVEGYLDKEIYLPRGGEVQMEFRPVDAESITVVFFRTSMAVTEVPELREVLRTWAGAVDHEEPQDFLRWRQRLGYDFGYLMTSEEHRVRIMQRFLCALWNGRVVPRGDNVESPESIEVRLGVENAVSMQLRLSPFGNASSWGSLLRGYEDWTITDDQPIRREFCERLMQTLPDGLEAAPRPPAQLYGVLRRMQEEQIAVLDAMVGRVPSAGGGFLGLLRGFWAQTLPDALDLTFVGVNRPVAGSLRELEGVVGW